MLLLVLLLKLRMHFQRRDGHGNKATRAEAGLACEVRSEDETGALRGFLAFSLLLASILIFTCSGDFDRGSLARLDALRAGTPRGADGGF